MMIPTQYFSIYFNCNNKTLKKSESELYSARCTEVFNTNAIVSSDMKKVLNTLSKANYK